MRVRLAVWNCNMRFHDKLEAVRLLNPHVLVVPECACPEVLFRRVPDFGATGVQWTGLHPGKGLAVFSFAGLGLVADRSHDPRGGSTLPVHVTGRVSFRLLAAWAVPRWSRRAGGRHPEPLGEAFSRLEPFLAGRPAAIAGDFNDALVVRLDRGRFRPSPLAQRIAGCGYVSPLGRAELAWGEGGPPSTFFAHRRDPKRNVSDSVFFDSDWVARVERVAYAGRRPWIRASDHTPVVVDVWVDSERETKRGELSVLPK